MILSRIVIGLLGIGLLIGLARADIPRLPNGKPDLSGRYNISTRTPYTRPAALGDRKYFTEEEAKSIADKAKAAREWGSQKSDPNRSAPEGETLGPTTISFLSGVIPPSR